MSRTTYALLGAAGGLAFVAPVLVISSADSFPSWLIPLATIGGGILGLVLHETQAWASHGPAAELARWILGGAVGAFLCAIAALVIGAVTKSDLPAALGLGMLAGVGFGVDMQRRTVFGGDGYRRRAPREVFHLWLVILSTLGVALGCFALSAHLTA